MKHFSRVDGGKSLVVGLFAFDDSYIDTPGFRSLSMLHVLGPFRQCFLLALFLIPQIMCAIYSCLFSYREM